MCLLTDKKKKSPQGYQLPVPVHDAFNKYKICYLRYLTIILIYKGTHKNTIHKRMAASCSDSMRDPNYKYFRLPVLI